MKAATARYSGLRRTGLASPFVVFVTALAFLLQSFITQTHVHGDAADHADQASAHISGQISGQFSASQGDIPFEQSQCPFCQAIVHAGAFLMPSSLPSLLPVATVSVALSFVMRAASAAAHNWQSRAPPSR